MSAKVWFALAAEALVFAAVLFGSAGTLRWPGAWAFLAIFFGIVIAITHWLSRHDPALLAERMKGPVQSQQPAWDRIILPSIGVLFLGWMVLMGVDRRFGWSAVPVWVQALGAAGVAVSLWMCARVFRANTFLAPVVKIQAERHHEVISTGPYAIVRHPLYAAVLLFLPATALLLGSWAGLAGTLAIIAGLVLRTALEDRELQRSLPGYADYASLVRYRLIPQLW